MFKDIPGANLLASGASRFVLLVSLMAGGVAQATDLLNQVVEAREAGAAVLALHLLDTHQPALRETPDVWIHWERERLMTLARSAQWSAIVRRRASPPPLLPSDFLRWWDTRVAEAHLSLRDGAGARALLLPLVWGTPAYQLDLYLPEWRRLIIRSYSVEQRPRDAYLALLRYKQDYGRAPRVTTARVLLGIGQIDEAGTLLVKPDTEDERLLALESSYQLGSSSAAEAAALIRGVIERVAAETDVALSAWIALHDIAEASGDASLRVEALEGIHSHISVADAPIGRFEAAALWDAYSRLAVETANANALLIGRFGDWLTLAESLHVEQPHLTRALYAHLVMESKADINNTAQLALADSVMRRAAGSRLLKSLFLPRIRETSGAEILGPLLHRLVEVALNERDGVLAIELAERLSTHSDAVSRILFVRVSLPAASPDEAAARLASLFNEFAAPDAEVTRHLHRAIVSLSERAPGATGRLLHRLLEGAVDSANRNGITLSLAALSARHGEFERAATYYLSLVAVAREGNDDDWMMESMLEAARMLALANRSEPARELYGQVLRYCEDPVRRVFIVNAIAQLGP